MPSSYSIPSVYSPQEPIYSNETYSNHSTAPATITGAIMGAGLGGYIGYRKNPYVNKAGEATDSFTKAVYERYINKANHLGKNSYNGGMNILRKLDNVKTPEEFKTLLENNKEAVRDIYIELKQSSKEFLSSITQENLNANKKTIKDKIIAGNETRFRDMKNKIQACWNKEQNKFIKNKNVKEEVFEAIENSTKKAKGKNIAKYTIIGAIITGILAYITSKFISSKKSA